MIRRWEIGIGLFGLLLSAFVLLVWLPNDIKGAFLETTSAGKSEPGDAFYPMVLTCFIGLMSVIQIVSGLTTKTSEVIGEPPEKDYAHFTYANLRFMLVFAVIVGTSITIMYWAGPVFVWFTQDTLTYRQLIDTAPYKYLGLLTGGFFLTFTLITWAEGRWRPRSAIVSLVLILLLILIFDVALTNIQLPPNADF